MKIFRVFLLKDGMAGVIPLIDVKGEMWVY